MTLLPTLLTRRCAWCDRIYGNGGWRASTELEDAARDQETATICPDCAALLRRDALSCSTPEREARHAPPPRAAS